MSRVIASRIAKLEAKRKANDLPKVICVIGGDYMQMIFDPENPGRLIWPEPPGGFPAFALAQQSRLLRELAEMSDIYEGNTRDVAHTDPRGAGRDDELAPLSPGQAKRRRFIEINGKEIDTFAVRGN